MSRPFELNMKKPCKDCPFLKGSSTNRTLHPHRIAGIIEDIRNDKSFTCHKTLPYYGEKSAKKEEHCAGALIMLEKEDNPNQIMRIAERVGMYDRTKLDMDADIINPEDYAKYPSDTDNENDDEYYDDGIEWGED